MRKEDLMMKFRKNQNKEKQIPKEKKPRVYKVNPHKKVVIALWVLLGLSFSFAIFKHFTAIDTHTIHETTIIEKEYVDTHHVENFVENFAKVYYSWEQSDKSIDNRMESLKGYLTDELQALNVDTVRKDIPVSSSVRGFQIWTVEPTGDNEFNVTYSVDQLITEGENTKTVHSAYIVSVYVDGSGNMVLVKNPTITNIPKKSSYKPKAIESEGTVDSITTNEINEFLTTFFKLYPTATASELSYYVNDGILKPIGKEYIFQELVNPIHKGKFKYSFALIKQYSIYRSYLFLDEIEGDFIDFVLEKSKNKDNFISLVNIINQQLGLNYDAYNYNRVALVIKIYDEHYYDFHLNIDSLITTTSRLTLIEEKYINAWLELSTTEKIQELKRIYEKELGIIKKESFV